MRPRDWWLSVGAVVFSLLAVAGAIAIRTIYPRYEFRISQTYVVRIDRWTGKLEALRNGAWHSVGDAQMQKSQPLTKTDDDELAKFLREHPGQKEGR